MTADGRCQGRCPVHPKQETDLAEEPAVEDARAGVEPVDDRVGVLPHRRREYHQRVPARDLAAGRVSTRRQSIYAESERTLRRK
jgi:hypothetical protein